MAMASWHSKYIQRLLGMTWDREVTPELSAAKLRARHAKMIQNFVRPASDVEVTKVQIGSFNAEWIEPMGAQFHRVIVYLHGGGYVTGSLAAYRNLVARRHSAVTVATSADETV